MAEARAPASPRHRGAAGHWIQHAGQIMHTVSWSRSPAQRQPSRTMRARRDRKGREAAAGRKRRRVEEQLGR
ncbi:hypothetical protein E2562_001913 [Oryza meyeriana var. granulata]|uniref:Uncharacterized protein n=1 Tax=Oryza meyeriana var. granulata TaxID=110450 RepID=A0A6G1C3S3_9ORYZ|nr:hypothetical protein E2562_001913 [Oryza meyeriana var. granulata]